MAAVSSVDSSPLSCATPEHSARSGFFNHKRIKRDHFHDSLLDSLSQSNASSIQEPGDLGSISSIDDSLNECTGNDFWSTMESSRFSLEQLRDKYKKEFKAAIKENYKYIMSEDIVESCKLTEGDFSALDSDDMACDDNVVTYNEFVRQYKELTDWLSIFQEKMRLRNPVCLSEKHLNQVHHGELLHRLTRQSQFNEYAAQLMKRYPSMKVDILTKQTHINDLWSALESIVCSNAPENPLMVLKDIELDLSDFEIWMNKMEEHLKELKSQSICHAEDRENMLPKIATLHKEVQPKSKSVQYVQQMCENLLSNLKDLGSFFLETRIRDAKSKSGILHRSWESLFIEILEWQLRVEGYSLNKGKCDLECENALYENDSLDDSDIEYGRSLGQENECNDFGNKKNFLPCIEEDTEEYDSSEKHESDRVNCLSWNGSKGNTFDVGYLSEEQNSHSEIGSKSPPLEENVPTKYDLRTNKMSCSCNTGSDFSDSSGIGVSMSAGSQVSKSKNVFCSTWSPVGMSSTKNSMSFDYLSSKMKYCVENDNSMPATEDEFSNDEMPAFLCGSEVDFSHSLDFLMDSSKTRPSVLSDVAVSDGEILLRSNRPVRVGKFGSMQKHKALFQLDKNGNYDNMEGSSSPKEKYSSSISKYFNMDTNFLVIKRTTQKRKFGETMLISRSDGNLIEMGESEKLPRVKVRKVVSCEELGTITQFMKFPRNSLKQKNSLRVEYSKAGDQLVPRRDDESVACDETSSLPSEVEMSDEDCSFISNVELWLDDANFENGFYKHSTPKMSKTCDMDPDCFDSDSDAEDFKVMLEDSIKALKFTQDCVARTVKSSKKILDSSSFLEPLATCQTSIKCLRKIEEAVVLAKRNSFDVLRLKALVNDWISLQSQILHHQKSAKQLVNSELDHLQSLLAQSRDNLNDIEIDPQNINNQSLHGLVQRYQREKKKLLEIQKCLSQLKKCVSPLRFKGSLSQEIVIQLDQIDDNCATLLNKVEMKLTSHLLVTESYSEFCKLCKEMDELLKVSNSQLQEITAKKCKKEALVGLVSFEVDGGWSKLTERLEQMKSLMIQMSECPQLVYLSLHNKFEEKKSLFTFMQATNQTLVKELLENMSETPIDVEVKSLTKRIPEDANGFSVESGPVKEKSGLGFVGKILKVGVPLSAAVLLMGWMYSNASPLCKDVLSDWSLILFPNLQHVRGRPPT